MTTTQESITSGQRKQLVRFVEDAASKAAKLAVERLPENVDREGLQRVLASGDQMQDRVVDTILAEVTTLAVGRYANEELESNYGYPDGYAIKSLEVQDDILRKQFPTLSLGSDVAGRIAWLNEFRTKTQSPTSAEGWFAIPRWQKIASTYGEAVKKVLTAIGSTRLLKNWREGQLSEKYLRQHERSTRMLEEIGKSQPGDIIIVAAQFGRRYRGRSVRRAREVFLINEFGLGTFAVACMLLTHPERLVQWEQLHVDCAGDEYSPYADGRFVCAPYFRFGGDGLLFSTGSVEDPPRYFGSASGFVPQEKLVA